MPGASVVFHRLAAREYRSARDWYADRAAQAAENFRIAVDRAVSRISSESESLPQAWTRVSFCASAALSIRADFP